MAQAERRGEVLRKARESVHQKQEESDQGLPVVLNERELSCLVFRELNVNLPSEEEYLRRRPLNAIQLLSRDQNMLSLIHFSPTNIEIRTGFSERTEQE